MAKIKVKLLDDVIKGLEEKKDFPGRWCKDYKPSCRDYLANYGDIQENCGHKCEYCEKYKWAVDRAIHYGEKLNLPWNEILASWEEDRTYWFMNYYQECEQPRIDSKDVFVFESVKEMQEKCGSEFICPSCGSITADPYECTNCHWKSYGLLKSNLAFLYCKKERKWTSCFMPKALKKEIQA